MKKKKIIVFSGKETREFGGYKYYPITWIGIDKGFIGVCGFTNKVFSVTTNPLNPLIIKDFYIGKNKCEEEKRCLNIYCKFNQTTPNSFLESKGIKLKGKRKVSFERKWSFEKNWFKIVKYWNSFDWASLIDK